MPGAGAGLGGSPAHGNDFGEFLSHALHAAAEQVEPRPDGLIPIRARILAGSGVPWPQARAISQYWLGPTGEPDNREYGIGIFGKRGIRKRCVQKHGVSRSGVSGSETGAPRP